MIVEDVDEESEEESEPSVTHSKDCNPSMILEWSNREKGKGILVDDKITKDVVK